MSKKKYLIIIAVIILTAGAGFYILGNQQKKLNPKENISREPTPEEKAEEERVKEWLEKPTLPGDEIVIKKYLTVNNYWKIKPSITV